MMSEDKGKTWQSVLSKYQTYLSSSGIGFRQIMPYTQIQGDTEPCIVVSSGVRGGLGALRIYKGGDHYFREVYLELDNTNGSQVITAKTGYLMPYPYKTLQESYTENMVYHIPLDEGCGGYVEDSRNEIAQISGRRSWDSKQSVRFGDYMGESTHFSAKPSSGLKVEKGASLILPANSDLNFDKNYTVSMWLNCAAFALSVPNDADRTNTIFDFRHLITIGQNAFCIRGTAQFGIIPSSVTPTIGGYSGHSFAYSGKAFSERTGMINSDQYFHVVFVVDGSKNVSVYVNGCPASSDWENDASNALGNLSTGDIKFGCDWEQGNAGYVSDVRVYNKAFSNTEVLMLYRGWKPYTGE